MSPRRKRRIHWSTGLHPTEDRDLYGLRIVTNVSGGSVRTRRRLANGPETRAFLNAALDLTTELFAAVDSAQLADVDEDDEARPVMSYLSRRKVLAKAQANNSDDLQLSENMMRHRWGSHSDFLADFISYALADKYLSLREAITRHATELRTSDEEFAGAVHLAAYEDLQLVFELPAFRFQLLAVATAQSDSASAPALASMYKDLSELWVGLYSGAFEHYGFKLRPGISMEDFDILMQAVSEGLAMRMIAGGDEAVVNHQKRTSLLGTASLALFMALIDPGDGLTLEQSVEQTLRQRHRK